MKGRAWNREGKGKKGPDRYPYEPETIEHNEYIESGKKKGKIRDIWEGEKRLTGIHRLVSNKGRRDYGLR